jgi:hypothetical protein
MLAYLLSTRKVWGLVIGFGAFLVAGLVLIAGVASFVFLLGRIEPLPEPAARDSWGRANPRSSRP